MIPFSGQLVELIYRTEDVKILTLEVIALFVCIVKLQGGCRLLILKLRVSYSSVPLNCIEKIGKGITSLENAADKMM